MYHFLCASVSLCHSTFPYCIYPISVLQTLFGNPKGPVELDNPDTCAETKLCLILFYSGSRSSFAISPKLLYSWFERKLGLVSLMTLLHRRTETTVSNKNECITKITTDENSIPRFSKLQSKINAIT